MSIINSMAANKKKSAGLRAFAVVLFFLYFAVLFYFLFFSEKMGRTYSERAYHYNLVPFHEIQRFIQYYEVLGMKAVLLNLAGNVVAFVPFGFFLPVFADESPDRIFFVRIIHYFTRSYSNSDS